MEIVQSILQVMIFECYSGIKELAPFSVFFVIVLCSWFMITSYCKLILTIFFFLIGVEIIFPCYLSWNISVDLCHYFNHLMLFCFVLVFFLPHCVCYCQGETQNTDLKICQWTLGMRQDFHGFTKVFKTSDF